MRLLLQASRHHTRDRRSHLDYDCVTRPGWVRGADDVLGIAATHPDAAAWMAATSERRPVAAAATTVAPPSSAHVLWLLQQSRECRRFVRREAERIAIERRRKQQPLLAAQTIAAELWAQLGRLFESAAGALSAAQQSSLRTDQHARRQPAPHTTTNTATTTAPTMTRDRRDGEAEIENEDAQVCAARFVATCADVLTRGSPHLRSAVPFTVERALVAAAANVGAASAHDIGGGGGGPVDVRSSSRLSDAFIAHACHVDDAAARMQLIASLGRSRAALHERLDMLARAEGLELPLADADQHQSAMG